jgi:hypothetical protein
VKAVDLHPVRCTHCESEYHVYQTAVRLVVEVMDMSKARQVSPASALIHKWLPTLTNSRLRERLAGCRAHLVESAYLDITLLQSITDLQPGQVNVTRDHSSKLELLPHEEVKCTQSTKIANDVYQLIYLESSAAIRNRFPEHEEVFEALYGPPKADEDLEFKVEYWDLFNDDASFGDGQSRTSFECFSRLMAKHRPWLCLVPSHLHCDNVNNYVSSAPLLGHCELNRTCQFVVGARDGPAPGHGKLACDRETGRIKALLARARDEGYSFNTAEQVVEWLNGQKPESCPGNYSYFFVKHVREPAPRAFKKAGKLSRK